MRLQIKPQRWMCLPTSFAMALDMPLADVLLGVGHDGSKIQWPDLPEPLCRRGFHPQELLYVCLARGYAATRLELIPALTPGYSSQALRVLSEDIAWFLFRSTIRHSRGVIEGMAVSNRRQCGHAVAYDHGRIFDPDGAEFPYSREACEARGFYTQHLWRVDRIGGSL
jgi:hypothetical protein